MEFPFYFFMSSDMNLQAYFIFFFPTSQKIPCRDLATIEYKAHALMADMKSLQPLICYTTGFYKSFKQSQFLAML